MDYNIKLTEYREFYNMYVDVINKACDCISRNPSNVLLNNIDLLKDSLITPLYKLDWDDSASEIMFENLTISNNNLEKIYNSIESDFKTSEQCYLDIKDQLVTLNENIDDFSNKINDKPSENSYKLEIRNEKNIIVDYKIDRDAYYNALESWQSKCSKAGNNCLQIINNINENLKKLEEINGHSLEIQGIDNMNLGFSIGGNAYKFAYFTKDTEAVLNSSSTEFSRNGGKLTVRFNQGSRSEWNETIGGISLSKSGCGIMSLATALTATFTYEAGYDVIVTPIDVANALNDYAKYNGKSGLSTYFPNGMGSYEGLTDAVSDIYGVTIVYKNTGRLDNEQVSNATNGGGTVVYSLANKSHIAAVTGLNENDALMIADTGSGKAGYVYGTDKFDGGKRSMIISSCDFSISDGKLVKDGSTKIPDIGDMTNIVIDGNNYDITRREIPGTNLYEYEIK